MDGTNVSKTVNNSYRWRYRVCIKLDFYQLRYSIIFKQQQMLHGQMLTLQISPRQLTTHSDGLTIEPSKFSWILTNNGGHMTFYLLFNYRDPPNKKKNFAKPVVDIAASSRSLTWQPSWGYDGKLGLQSNWKYMFKSKPWFQNVQTKWIGRKGRQIDLCLN